MLKPPVKEQLCGQAKFRCHLSLHSCYLMNWSHYLSMRAIVRVLLVIRKQIVLHISFHHGTTNSELKNIAINSFTTVFIIIKYLYKAQSSTNIQSVGGQLDVNILILMSCQVNLLSVVLNDAPILPEADEDVTSLLKDSPQCMTFGLFMIWWVLHLMYLTMCMLNVGQRGVTCRILQIQYSCDTLKINVFKDNVLNNQIAAEFNLFTLSQTC